jgi:hypothetical protein
MTPDMKMEFGAALEQVTGLKSDFSSLPKKNL